MRGGARLLVVSNKSEETKDIAMSVLKFVCPGTGNVVVWSWTRRALLTCRVTSQRWVALTPSSRIFSPMFKLGLATSISSVSD